MFTTQSIILSIKYGVLCPENPKTSLNFLVKNDENINILKLLRKQISGEVDAGVTHPGPLSFPHSGVNFMRKTGTLKGNGCTYSSRALCLVR